MPIQWLNRLAKGVAMAGADGFMIFGEKPSGQVDFLAFIFNK